MMLDPKTTDPVADMRARARAIHPIDLLDASYAALSRHPSSEQNSATGESAVRADG